MQNSTGRGRSLVTERTVVEVRGGGDQKADHFRCEREENDIWEGSSYRISAASLESDGHLQWIDSRGWTLFR